MNQLCSVQVVDGFGGLIDDVTSVLVSQHVLADKGVEVDIHELEKDVYVPFVGAFENLFQLHYVGVLELLKEHDFAVCTLSVCAVLEGIKIFLESK